MRASTLSNLVICSVLLTAGVVQAAEVPRASEATCPPAVQPPERILDTWAELDREEGLLPPLVEPYVLAPPAVVPESDETLPEEPAAAAPPPVLVEADTVLLVQEGVSQLEGDVWVQQGENFLSSEALEFNKNTGVVRTLAPARFGSRQLILDAENVIYDTSAGKGVFESVDFFMPRHGGRGEADQLARTGEFTSELQGVLYTTCPPEDEDWWLKASSMDLDREDGMGVARNVRLGFMGVPFFYLPWMSFPIDERRKTGFLFPEFGDSGRNGTWLRTPYYLNLAPNMDATLTPYYMSERGTALEGEFRYLFGWGAGELDATYLDNDRMVDSHRYFYRYGHVSRLPTDWTFSVDYQQVSDEEYFQDFSQDGRGLLRSHIAQVATLSKSELEYGASVGLQRFQTVDPTIPEASRPYEKWPEIDYYYAPLAFGNRLWFDVQGESVQFRRDDRVSGWRHHTETAFSMDFGDPGLRLTPRLAWWETKYDLEQADGTDLDLSRGLPVTSLDLRARFARALGSGGRQTLEPRLFLVHIPFREQDAIPLFDTRPGSDTLASLFQANRFTGVDRVGDTKRATFGLESSLIGRDGREWFSAAIARAWYLDDREVQFGAADEPETESASNYYGELEYRPTETQNLRLDLSYDPHAKRTDYGSIQYQFKPGEFQVLNLAYRFRRLDETAEPLEQVDFSFATKLGGRWSVFGRAVYSLPEKRSQETLAGFEYETCCWVFRTFQRRFIFNRAGEFDRSLWFQLELKGLSSVGRRIDEFLTEDIYGYGETE
ncbi:MAG TPA: LPS assembly protein LptD [Gammaproteobacteria bacterium]